MQFSPYKYSANYDENSIGCTIGADYLGKKVEDQLSNNFKGEMSALHFIEVAGETIQSTHKLLSKISRMMSMQELYPLLSYGEFSHQNNNKIILEDIQKNKILERLFLIINPSYSDQGYNNNGTIFVGKQTEELINHVEFLYSQTTVQRTVPAKFMFISIGGVRTLLPLMDEIADKCTLAEDVHFLYY